MMNIKAINHVTRQLSYLNGCLNLVCDEIDNPVFPGNSLYMDGLIEQSSRLEEEISELQERLDGLKSFKARLQTPICELCPSFFKSVLV